MKYYQLLAILSPERQENEVKAAEDHIKELLKAQEAEAVRIENLGKIKLAYPIGNHRYGIYVLVIFKAEPKAIAVFKKAFQLTDGLARFDIAEVTEAALRRQYHLNAYQEPVVDHDRERDEARSRMRVSAPAVAAVAKAVPVKTITDEEVNAQIEKILDEKVL